MVRLPLSPLFEGERALPAAAARYLSRVLRLAVGDRFEAFDPSVGAVAPATVVACGKEIVVSLGAAVVAHDEPPLVLVQGHPKGDKLGDIVRDATELGATTIIPAICARSVARPDEARGLSRAARLSTIAAEAARQCGRTRAPTISPPLPFAEAIEIARALAAHRFLLWERATVPLGPDLVAAEAGAGIAFVIGPEGGLEQSEVAHAEALGFAPRALGRTILRTETAATAVLAAARILSRS